MIRVAGEGTRGCTKGHATPMPLSRRASGLAIMAGVVAFAVSLLAALLGEIGHALVPAIACAVLCWAAAQRHVAETATAIDEAVLRLQAAAAGDLSAPIPESTRRRVPELGSAMRALFEQLAANFARVEHLAAFDPVTGLANRGSFRDSAGVLLDMMHPREPAALFFIDLDRFKVVNDSHGHACGDQVLSEVARRLERAVAAQGPARSIVGRLAGDEFTVLCPGMGEPVAVQRLGDAIVASLGAPFKTSFGTINVGASVGVAIRPEHGGTLQELMRGADAAMYRSKADGRARMSRFSASLAAEIAEREQLDRELADALVRHEFELLFQPQIDVARGELVAAEALLRWRHPTLGLRTPAAFLQRAERNGQILAIGQWSAGAIAGVAAQWEAEARPGRFALNLGGRELETPALLHAVRTGFAGAGAPLARLEIEIGEGVATRLNEGVVEVLSKLRAGGATIAIDDFGTGESNVQRLRALPIDRIKLDSALIAPIAEDNSARTIAQALIGLIHGLGCGAVAEGVETQAQLDVLNVLGCDAAQGYGIAHPMTAAELSEWNGPGVNPRRARA